MLTKELLFALPCLCVAALGPVSLSAADLPPDKGDEIPASARREVIVTLSGPAAPAPAHALPKGYTLTTAAAAPLVRHPIMGCVDDRGRLFVGDAVGVNWNKAQLEKNPPNRVLMLEDTDADGTYDRSTVFADGMTFPQGAAWLDGSLYVGSPPGIWKLTDTDGDGVADDRKMIVSGFDYTGNAADVHGPKVHPNGRLYWCHGRKGLAVIGKEGKIVHEGKSSGIWTSKPDGSDVQWHSLGCADNPTGLAFTPQGDIIGTCNLYYSQPRGDTLMHWLYGGVYERADQMQAIAGLPRTLDKMPIIHNFGHVAVSGCELGRDGALYVTHFNTQRLVRMDLTPDGATFKTTENEFLKINDPDVHLTDVIVDRDGSLLVLNTGGWFRIGCPSSLMAKPDMLGSVYRIRGPKPAPAVAASAVPDWKPDWKLTTKEDIAQQLQSKNPCAVLHALTALARRKEHEPDLSPVLMQLLARPLEPVLEHAVLNATRESQWISLDEVRATTDPVLLRRLMLIVQQQPEDAAKANLNMGIAAENLDAADADLARTALGIVIQHPDADEWVAPGLQNWLGESEATPQRLRALEQFCEALVDQPETQKLITAMLGSKSLPVRDAALRVLASRAIAEVSPDWLPHLDPGDGKNLSESGRLPLLLAALKRLKAHPFDASLQALADDEKQPLSLRLKALDSMKSRKMTDVTFDLLRTVLTAADSSSAARIQAASMLAAAPLQPAQIQALAPALASVGPVEMKELLPLIRRTREVEQGRALATEMAKNPALISQQESLYRTAFSNLPPEIFETLILPARQRAEEGLDAKKRQLGLLAEKAATQGKVEAGASHFRAGKGTCMACHKIADFGRALGPDLSKIGAIRTERDLLESILFPSNTLARDYEAHVLEMADGQSVTGVIRSHTAEGLLVMDLAGQETSLPHDRIISNTVLTTSLMPMGLDATMTEQELLDLVAYLRSLK
ncbi:PVC-type heme-binding CxxCH protein [Prosthecobacter sp. SYSU 5D2]|uniref:PVC-type heme-binding CxxCH protein n=1 Tax=Prosthecobacter sp. SYSU 5D2 TaxID=3134134 RepID=UPI0031FF01E3